MQVSSQYPSQKPVFTKLTVRRQLAQRDFHLVVLHWLQTFLAIFGQHEADGPCFLCCRGLPVVQLIRRKCNQWKSMLTKPPCGTHGGFVVHGVVHGVDVHVVHCGEMAVSGDWGSTMLETHYLRREVARMSPRDEEWRPHRHRTSTDRRQPELSTSDSATTALTHRSIVLLRLSHKHHIALSSYPNQRCSRRLHVIRLVCVNNTIYHTLI